MPTYNWKCQACGREEETVRSIREHTDNPLPHFCCQQQMDRYFPPQAFRAIDNPLAGDRSYDGLRAQDGTDISSRSKHRAYMKQHGLTTADDYTESWAKAEKARDLYRQGLGGGAITRNDIAETIARMTGT